MRVLSLIKKMSLRRKVCIALLLSLLLLELFFDVFEISIGMLMLATNDYRPKVGRLWNEEEKDELGRVKVTTLLDSLSQIPVVHRKIKNLQDLRDYLAYKSHLLMPRDEFIDLYRSFPADEAARLLDPSLLFDLTQSSNWQTMRLSFSADKIALLFLDSFGQPILDMHCFVGDLTHVDGKGHLQDDPQFEGRTVSGNLFALAYQNLNPSLRLQIINNPQLYELWRDRLLQVGIAPVIQNGSVMLAFEVTDGAGTAITKLQGSRLAVSHLIHAINNIAPIGQTISAPVKEE